MGPRIGLDRCGKSRPHRDSIPDPTARSQSLYRLGYSFITTALEWGNGSESRPGALFTPGKNPVPIIQEDRWATGPVWTGAENLAPTTGFDPGPSSPQPVAIPTGLLFHYHSTRMG